jgi:hypothetical protein
MIYIDENGNQIESYDLTLGYLVDHEWIDHPAVAQSGHYEYGDGVQAFVVDVPAESSWREVTIQKYILYTESELEYIAQHNYVARLGALEAADIDQENTNELQTVRIATQEEKIIEQEAEIVGLKSALEYAQAANDMLTECVLEMSAVVYA